MKKIKYIPKFRIDSKRWFLAWNSPKNPFGNYHEPMPFPAKHEAAAPTNEILAFLWWQFWRNPLHNFTHFTIGIVPVGERYEWVTPDEDGWTYETLNKCWVKGPKHRCQKELSFWGFEGYIGWSERGSFGMSFRKSS